MRQDFINPYVRLPPLHNRPSILAQYRRRVELQKAKAAAAVVLGESSNSLRGSSDEKAPMFQIGPASSTDSLLNITNSENSSQQPLLAAPGPPHSGPSVHFDDNVQVHEAEAARSSESSSQQPLLGPHSGGPSVHFDETVQVHHEGVRRARRRVKGRWTRLKVWARREWRVKWK